MESCLYEGVVHHERLKPLRHRFHYKIQLAYLDLAELPTLMRSRLVSTSRCGVASFRRADHLGDARRKIDDHVRDLVEQETGSRPRGPVRVLTQLSCLGYSFSPLSLSYLYGLDGASIQSIVAEVQNTPWLERHAYVLWDGNRETGAGDGVYRHGKAFHVSPFMRMSMHYRWRLKQPGETIQVGIENLVGEELVFRAGLHLWQLPLTQQNRRRLLFRYPLWPFRITAAIYWQAFQLWRKKCPFYSHPKHVSQSSSDATDANSSSRVFGNEPFVKNSCDA